ncbi:hypothetical protein [Natrinema amylolyticum]|uniref:hypothetical protein n=1 Tax=Natrinema amylolyticum TaxID=2878679 RepID=UPI001CFBE188|nr:hypothetical protein [Natrinema amylolyticum]
MSMLTFWPWIALALLSGLFVFSSALCLCYAIGTDAAARGASGVGWTVFAVLFLPIAVPVYAVYRTRLPARDASPEPLERGLGAFGIGGTAAFITSALVAPPDPLTQLLYLVPSVLVFVPAAAVVYYKPDWRALVS